MASHKQTSEVAINNLMAPRLCKLNLKNPPKMMIHNPNAPCMDYLPTFLDEKWPNSKGKCGVNIPYMEHLGKFFLFFLLLKFAYKS